MDCQLEKFSILEGEVLEEDKVKGKRLRKASQNLKKMKSTDTFLEKLRKV